VGKWLSLLRVRTELRSIQPNLNSWWSWFGDRRGWIYQQSSKLTTSVAYPSHTVNYFRTSVYLCRSRSPTKIYLSCAVSTRISLSQIWMHNQKRREWLTFEQHGRSGDERKRPTGGGIKSQSTKASCACVAPTPRTCSPSLWVYKDAVTSNPRKFVCLWEPHFQSTEGLPLFAEPMERHPHPKVLMASHYLGI